MLNILYQIDGNYPNKGYAARHQKKQNKGSFRKWYPFQQLFTGNVFKHLQFLQGTFISSYVEIDNQSLHWPYSLGLFGSFQISMSLDTNVLLRNSATFMEYCSMEVFISSVPYTFTILSSKAKSRKLHTTS